MIQSPIAIPTLLALLLVVGTSTCDPCDPCDDGNRIHAAQTTPDRNTLPTGGALPQG
jgi:hypothetical protein